MDILIVEDSSLIRVHLKRIISEIPELRTVAEADRPSDAIEAFGTLHPDIVILDVKLKDGTGFEVLDSIKKNEPKPLIIVFTNYANRWYREAAMRGGADYFFEKNKDLHKVADLLKHHLRA